MPDTKFQNFKILQSYSMEFKSSEFFGGCLSNPTNAKKKIDKSNIQAN